MTAYDPTTDIGKVRFLCSDTNPHTFVFSDGEVTAALGLNNGNVRLAAAQMLEVWAVSEVLIQKRITMLGLSTDGPGEATALQALAKELRRQVTEDEADFGVVEWAVSNFSRRNLWLKEFANGYGAVD